MIDQHTKDLITYRLNRAIETIGDAQLLANAKRWNPCVNRLYYACYYAITALLVKHEINPKTHTGVRQMFGLHFIKTGKLPIELGIIFSDIFDKRQTSDYDDFVNYGKEEIIELLPSVKELIDKITQMVKK